MYLLASFGSFLLYIYSNKIMQQYPIHSFLCAQHEASAVYWPGVRTAEWLVVALTPSWRSPWFFQCKMSVTYNFQEHRPGA